MPAAALLSSLLSLSEPSGTLVFERPGLLEGIAAILSAVAWPLLVGAVLFWFRKPLSQMATVAVGIASSSSKVKIWQIEFDRDVQQQLDASAHEALSRQPAVSDRQLDAPIPAGEFEAASKVRSMVDEAPSDSVRSEILESIRKRILGFAREYESTRSTMPAGTERTRAMNAVAAKMRTLALAADPFVDELAGDPDSPGKRLAAICILQLAPSLARVNWLADRMQMEQPFVFFHASVALLSAVRKYGKGQHALLRAAVERALTQVTSFGEKADRNTIRSLTLALSELDVPAA